MRTGMAERLSAWPATAEGAGLGWSNGPGAWSEQARFQRNAAWQLPYDGRSPCSPAYSTLMPHRAEECAVP